MLGWSATSFSRIAGQLLRQQPACLFRQNVNFLYSPAAIGRTGYEFARDKTKEQFTDLEEKFRSKMLQNVENAEPNSTVFTEDLKHMVHLANDDDLDLVKKMMTKFVSQNKDLRFGSYVFGPVVMRMFHFLNKPKEALEVFQDPAFNDFFDQLVTIQILMDLLFENGMYDDVLKIFEIVKKKQLQGSKYPKNAIVLVYAALYKINTPESNEYSKRLWSDLNETGSYPMRKAATFAAALAINQGEPAVALEILTTVKKQSYYTVRNLKIIALVDLGRPDDALPILRSILEVNDLGQEMTHTICKETIDKVKECINKIDNPEVTAEFERIAKSIADYKLVSRSPLSEQLCSPIEALPQQQNQQGNVNNRFGQTGRFNHYQRRPGVMNMA